MDGCVMLCCRTVCIPNSATRVDKKTTCDGDVIMIIVIEGTDDTRVDYKKNTLILVCVRAIGTILHLKNMLLLSLDA